MTDRQVKAITEFVIFVRTLTENVRSLLKRFQDGHTFEEKIDEEIRGLETCVGQRLKEFDKALDETNPHPLSCFVIDLLGKKQRGKARVGVKSDEKKSESLMYLKG
jgi:hypothetical protein